jgi:copper chaperone CopZ
MATTHFKIARSSDIAASAHIEKALSAVSQVKTVHVDLQSGRVTIDHEGVDPEKLKRAIVTSGLPAELAANE